MLLFSVRFVCFVFTLPILPFVPSFFIICILFRQFELIACNNFFPFVCLRLAEILGIFSPKKRKKKSHFNWLVYFNLLRYERHFELHQKCQKKHIDIVPVLESHIIQRLLSIWCDKLAMNGEKQLHFSSPLSFHFFFVIRLSCRSRTILSGSLSFLRVLISHRFFFFSKWHLSTHSTNLDFPFLDFAIFNHLTFARSLWH